MPKTIEGKVCEHYWSYADSVYSGERSGTQVYRFCHQCKVGQWGRVTNWTDGEPPDPNPFEAEK